MTALALRLLHASCAVMICSARAYLGEIQNIRDCCGAAGSVLGTLVYGNVVGIGVGSTLRDGAVVWIGDGTTLGDGAVVGIGNSPLSGDVV